MHSSTHTPLVDKALQMFQAERRRDNILIADLSATVARQRVEIRRLATDLERKGRIIRAMGEFLDTADRAEQFAGMVGMGV